MPKYSDLIKELTDLKEDKPSIFKHINPQSASRMRLQNRFPTGLDIARYTAKYAKIWLIMIRILQTIPNH